MNILTSAKNLWMRFAHILGRINTTIMLSIFYVVVIGAMSIVVRLAALVKPDRGGWKKKEPFEPTLDWASHQF